MDRGRGPFPLVTNKRGARPGGRSHEAGLGVGLARGGADGALGDGDVLGRRLAAVGSVAVQVVDIAVIG